MRDVIAVIAGLIAIFSVVPYIVDTVKGRTHPNIVTWFTWTLLTGIGAAAAWNAGATTTAVFAGATTIATGLVTILGFKGGVKKYTRFDVACQALALVGVVLWQTTSQPAFAVAIVVATDMTAALPTYRHCWREPEAETWQAFALGAVASVLTLTTITQISFVALAYPVWIATSNIALASIIIGRRRMQKAAA